MTRLAGHRRPRWRVELLDHDDNILDVLGGVSGLSVEIAATERLGGSASLTLDDVGHNIDWMQHRIRIVYNPGVRGVEAWPLGVFLLSSPVEKHGGGKVTWTISCLTKLAVIDEVGLDTPWSFPAGTPVVPTVVDLIASTGESLIAVTDTDATLTSTMSFDAGESTLTVINKLLQAAGYWTLKVDTHGVFQVQPWTRPTERAISWNFHAGEASLFEDEWEKEQNLSSVPNKVVCRTTGTDEEPALVGVAVNVDPTSPFSYEARGKRWRTRVYDVEAVDQGSVQSQAEQRLLANMDPVLKIEATHALVPLEANQVISFLPPGAEEAMLCTVQRMSMDGTFDAQVKATWRGVTGSELSEGSLDTTEAF